VSKPGLLKRVVVSPPNPAWAEAFAREAAFIQQACPAITAQHIGSTAIQGIWAKPIIDMLLTAESLEDFEAATPQLQALGYEARGEFGIPGRRYFMKNDAQGERLIHAHGFEQTSAEATRHMAFREYMNAHPDTRQAYSDLKRQLAAAHPSDIEAYMDGKDAFIKHHEALALAWASEQGLGTSAD
jgi:GrpB-like predicted nucleotidyltransferase (UPF0157 family)